MPRNGIKKQFWLPKELVERLADYSKRTKLPETTIIKFLLKGYHPREAPGMEFYEALSKIWERTEELRNVAWVYINSEDKALLMEKADAIDDLTFEIEKKFLLPEKFDEEKAAQKMIEQFN